MDLALLEEREHAHGQAVADNAADLAVGDASIFLGVAEYVDWDTVAPTLVAFPAGGGDALWSTRLVDEPGERFDIRDVSVGPEGALLKF